MWIAWQLNSPEKGKGLVQAFRRDEAKDESCRLKLQGPDPHARYSVNSLGEEKEMSVTGRQLMESGLLVTITRKPGAAVVTHKRK